MINFRESIVNRLRDSFCYKSPAVDTIIEKGLTGFFSNKIGILYTTADVIDIATRNDIQLTRDQAKKVLTTLETNFDISTGINYSTIKKAIFDLRELEYKQEKVKNSCEERLDTLLESYVQESDDGVNGAFKNIITDLMKLHKKVGSNSFKDIIKQAQKELQ